ncbi:unnamed protein product, partial [Musa hybrid cultivar]
SLPSSLRFAGYKVPFRTELGQDQIIRCYYYKIDIGGFKNYIARRTATKRVHGLYIYIVQSTNK